MKLKTSIFLTMFSSQFVFAQQPETVAHSSSSVPKFSIGYLPSNNHEVSFNYRLNSNFELSLAAQAVMYGASDKAISLGLGASYVLPFSNLLDFRPIGLMGYINWDNFDARRWRNKTHFEIPLANVELKHDRFSLIVGPRVFQSSENGIVVNAIFGEFRFAF